MLTQSRSALITSPHPTATHAGRTILAAGGNAIEAAIATVAVLGVVYPHMVGIGGDACWLIGHDDRDCQGILGIGQAAPAIETLTHTVWRGVDATLTTAGAIASWDKALEISRGLGGTLTLEQLLAPAIQSANEGYAVTASQAFWHAINRDELRTQPGFAAIFEPNGVIPARGERQRQPRLGATLTTLAREGLGSFYDGPLAARIIAGLASAGSSLSAQDLAATAADVVAPLRVPYRRGHALNLPLPTQGVTALQILGTLDHFDLASLGPTSGEFYALVIAAIQQALTWRNTYAGDPRFNPPRAEMLAASYLRACADAIKRGGTPAPTEGTAADTVWLGVHDRQGLNVSLIQSVFFGFGSGTIAGDTGILWHNRCAAFNNHPGHANARAAGKRPLHTLSPAMYVQDHRIRVLYGSQGGDGQTQTQTQILAHLVDFGADPWAALSAPRIHVGPTFLDRRNTIKVEGHMPPAVVRYLRACPLPLEMVTPFNAATGEAGIILIDDAGLAGAHDPRGEGLCLGL
ncbi:MAG: gamma-glutamyltransferase family protein [Acidiferrobacter sp.]